MNQTSNFGLNQWEKTDRIQMEDFNADNAKIDAALALTGNCSIETGSYVGDGTYGANHPNTLTFSFVPKVVFITRKSAPSNGHRAILIHGCTAAQSTDYLAFGITSVTWDDANKSVSWYSTDGDAGQSISAQMNGINTEYLYVALG